MVNVIAHAQNLENLDSHYLRANDERRRKRRGLLNQRLKKRDSANEREINEETELYRVFFCFYLEWI